MLLQDHHKDFFLALSICHTVQVVGHLNDDKQMEATKVQRNSFEAPEDKVNSSGSNPSKLIVKCNRILIL